MQLRLLHCEAPVAQTGEVKVSARGQMALPAQTRHRWGLDDGGTIGWVDLGDAVLLVPGGASELRNALLTEADWGAARSGFGDPELANQ
jgi:bifunctional DNA-binding transcriptional regulator/antitoxin component of YhaV-PrlF toxin-antitoxin module